MALHTPDTQFPPGTRMVFDQDLAPIGWTRDTAGDLNDRIVMVVGGSRTHGGSWTVSGVAAPSHTHSVAAGGTHSHTGVTGSVGDHQHTISSDGSHDHDMPFQYHGGVWAWRTTAPFGEGASHSFPRTLTQSAATSNSRNYSKTSAAGSHDHGGNTGLGGGHNHSISAQTNHDHDGASGAAAPAANSDGTWRPLHRDTIVAVRN